MASIVDLEEGASQPLLDRMRGVYEDVSIYKTIVITNMPHEASDIYHGLEEDGHTCIVVDDDDIENEQTGHSYSAFRKLEVFRSGSARVLILTVDAMFKVLERFGWAHIGDHNMLVLFNIIHDTRMDIYSSLPEQTGTSQYYYILNQNENI